MSGVALPGDQPEGSGADDGGGGRGDGRARLRGLIVDWGGVLTGDLGSSTAAWSTADGIPAETAAAALMAWTGEEAPTVDNPVHALERGEMAVAEFERWLAARLRRSDGRPVEPAGLITRMFAHVQGSPLMLAAVVRLRAAGVRTALLSNSWGHEYQRDGWTDAFDAVVISGEVGMRKPDTAIYRHTLDLIGCAPRETVFIDDAPVNVRAAVAMGVVGIHHRSVEETLGELAVLFGLDLGVDSGPDAGVDRGLDRSG